RSQVAGEVVGGVLARHVQVHLAQVVLDGVQLDVGKVAGDGAKAGDALAVFGEQVAAAVPGGDAVRKKRAAILRRRHQALEDPVEAVGAGAGGARAQLGVP